MLRQAVWNTTLKLLSHQYLVTAICDVSRKGVDHVASKRSIPHTLTSNSEMVQRDDIDLALIANNQRSSAV